VLPAIINTFVMVGVSLVISVPLGICCAIYLVEYASRKNRLIKYIRLTTETLSGIPSIVFGLFGMLFFVTTLGMGLSIISGSLTVSIMILPLIIRSTEEALKSVPDSFREASFGIGAGKLRTVLKIVLPSAVPGILAGVILSIGRIIGETAALLYTAGSAPKIAGSLAESGRTLSIHMYALSKEGFYTDEAFATAVILLATVFFLNTIASVIAKKLAKN
jgi:phosphate transport system permease protein